MSQAPKTKRWFRRTPAPIELKPPQPEVSVSDARKIITRAIELIRDYGWQQGGMGRKEVGFCMLGALRYAARDLHMRDAPYEEAKNLVAESLPWKIGLTKANKAIPRYNDHVLTNRYAAMDTLRKADMLAALREG